MYTMTAPVTPPESRTGQPWYREPYVWLVLAGPLAVILASVVTIYLAVTRADPVLQNRTPPVPRTAPAAAAAQTPDERLAADKALLPAGQGRNHAVSPELPKR